MSYLVRIEPSGHTFTALPQESLLEAALRSGINATYNCSSGTCGDCRVRLLSGDVESSMPADYPFSVLERNDGYFLLCANRAMSDLVIQAEEAHTPGDIPLQQITAKVAKVEHRGEHVRVLHLRTPRTNTLRFMAGQHACLTLPGVGSRDVAIASCPCNGMNLQFHFPERGDDPFTVAVFNGLHVGQAIELEGPFGDITLDDDSVRPLLMLAVGTDFAPVKSLIEHAINLNLRQPIRLVWLVSEQEGHYLDNYCRAWGEVLDDYRFIPLTMDGIEPGRDELAGLKEVIAEQLDGFGGIDVYLAGSSLFREVVREHLLTLGTDPSRVFEIRKRYSARPESRMAHA